MLAQKSCEAALVRLSSDNNGFHCHEFTFSKKSAVNLSCVVVLQRLAKKCTKMYIVGVDTQPPSSVHCLSSPIFHART